jgi:ubiquinol-cytochrome c reductase cytochrome c subunit
LPDSDRDAAQNDEGAVVTDDEDTGIGFEPAVSDAPIAPDASRAPDAARTRRTGLRRRLGAGVVLTCALALLGGVYAQFANSSGAASTGSSAKDIAAGRQIYQNSCITCHGSNLQGVVGQGPPLIGVGSAAVYFQVSTGRMPASLQGADEPAKPPKFDEKQIDQLGAYVESVGGGPDLPLSPLRGPASVLGQGGEQFRLNCASCHGVTGKGAPLSAGKQVPALNTATDRQIWAAMLSGPANMPVFGDNEITPKEKQAIVEYIQTLKASADPGGAGLDRIGPVSEAIVIWVCGVGVLMVIILWIGAKVR